MTKGIGWTKIGNKQIALTDAGNAQVGVQFCELLSRPVFHYLPKSLVAGDKHASLAVEANALAESKRLIDKNNWLDRKHGLIAVVLRRHRYRHCQNREQERNNRCFEYHNIPLKQRELIRHQKQAGRRHDFDATRPGERHRHRLDLQPNVSHHREMQVRP